MPSLNVTLPVGVPPPLELFTAAVKAPLCPVVSVEEPVSVMVLALVATMTGKTAD